MERLKVLKTYKIYIGGKFPRTESGRYYVPKFNRKGIANVCLSSRKDVRNAIQVARKAQEPWAARAANNRGQILYRIAEMMEGRSDQFISELELQGMDKNSAKKEIDMSIDRWIYYAGWCDKFQQIYSSVNPVASPHFNFSVLEPSGVYFIVVDDKSPLLSIVSTLAPVIAAGNSVVLLAPKNSPLSAITLAEIMQTSDVPGGVVNILTGDKDELVDHFSRHLDVNGVVYSGDDKKYITRIKKNAASNLKRTHSYTEDWYDKNAQGPYFIKNVSEVKTTWHPIENINASGSGY
ncbi:MAG: acyl-CoA reductase-like NAD-dependent aldehyde dehydrogenase [Ulvibacter sp.]|jgi:acyl-CoA reductase-like NAD-dependent aldehyde dehydrogenase